MLEITSSFKSYVNHLLDKNLIQDQEFDQFLGMLKLGKLINPISEARAKVDALVYIHWEMIEQEYLQKAAGRIDLKDLLGWATQIRDKNKISKGKQRETEEKTKYHYRQITFRKIPKGKFFLKKDPSVEIELTRDFEMTDTHITQKQWVELMGKNPARFKDGDDSVKLQIGGKEVLMQPDHPVEAVSWWSVLEFANRLSRQHGLKPAYDLSKVKFFQDSSAEDGTWATEDQKVGLNVPWSIAGLFSKKTVYDTVGYRLPTVAEMEYFEHLTSDGAHNEWRSLTAKDFQNETQAVAQRKSIQIQGSGFYDVHSSVLSWAWDWYHSKINGGKDPIQNFPKVLILFVDFGNYSRSLYGSSHYTRSQNANPARSKAPSQRSSDIGFRLVRTLPPQK